MLGSASTAPPAGARVAPAWRFLGYALGAFFVATGVLKLAGSPLEIVPGAAMLAHPAWFRTVVGLAETLCGLLLFAPAAAALGALGLSLLMVGALGTRLATGEPGAVYPALLLLALVLVTWASRPDDVRAVVDGELARPHPILRAGVIGGSLAAASIALWFLLVDSIAGHPFRTPLLLGRAFLSVLEFDPAPGADAAVVATYTAFHFATFIAIAIVAEWVVERARRQPAVLAGALMLFAAFQLGIYGFVAVLQEATGLGALVWWQVMVGNLIAAAVLGTYIWRHHLELPAHFRQTLEGTV
jgi:hypothetical protein